MSEDSGNSRFNIIKYIRTFLIFALIIFAVVIVIPVGLFLGFMFYTVYTPPRDSVYIGYLEFYAGDSLTSCRVINKKYDESYYTTAIYRISDSDFEKVLNGVQNYKYLDTVTSRDYNDRTLHVLQKETIRSISRSDYNDVAIQLLRKEANCNISQLDYNYSIHNGTTQIGFKRPDIILFFKRIYD